MNFEQLQNKTIMLFGKSRAFTPSEFTDHLSKHHISVCNEADTKPELIVQGRLVNPIEQGLLDDLYARKVAPIIEVDALDEWLCQQIDGETLLMSLKLSGDTDRLMGYLQNSYITDTLYLRLLKLYNWQGEGFFDNDENRDITASLVSRFYENIERNHNVQYANMGIMHLLNQSNNKELAETIALLEPLQTALKKGCDNSTQKILNAIALHENSSVKVLKQWVKNGNEDIQTLVAMRHDLSLQLQEYLLNLNISIIKEVLSLNHTIDHSVALILMQAYPENIARHITLDTELFKTLVGYYAEGLAANESLSVEMQKALLQKHIDVKKVLAKNSVLERTLFETLLESSDVEVVAALIANETIREQDIKTLYQRDADAYALAIAKSPKSDPTILQNLANSSDIEVLLALAKNGATPIDLLYQFQLDSRLARAVKENESFGKHIQRDNIGWDV